MPEVRSLSRPQPRSVVERERRLRPAKPPLGLRCADDLWAALRRSGCRESGRHPVNAGGAAWLLSVFATP